MTERLVDVGENQRLLHVFPVTIDGEAVPNADADQLGEPICDVGLGQQGPRNIEFL